MTTALPDWTAQLTGEVRANPAYRLYALDALPASYRTALERMGVDIAPVFGFLVAQPGSGLPDKIVDRPAAALFSDIAGRGRLDLETRRLAALVLDGVLEIEGHAGFVSGPLAFAMTGGPARPDTCADRLTRISVAALDYAERLRLDCADALTARLYAYYRIPLSRSWERAYPDRDAVLDLLPRRLLATHWVGSAKGASRYWLSWSARTAPSTGRDRFPYKLYVSPRIEELPAVLPEVVRALAASGATRFKIGADAPGLLRPDKIVVYLRDVHETEGVANALARAVDGAQPHGVPFSAGLAGDGLVSWGGDPPGDAGPAGRRAESWRLSVCRRLAEHLLVAARAAVPGIRPVDFTLARLALDDVDVGSFAPTALPAPAAVTGGAS